MNHWLADRAYLDSKISDKERHDRLRIVAGSVLGEHEYTFGLLKAYILDRCG